MNRLNDIQARLAEINAALDTATGEELTALENESRSLLEEMNAIKDDIEARKQLRKDIAAGAGTPVPSMNPAPAPSDEERAAKEFTKTRSMTLDADQARATLISGGTLAQPTKVDGINDIPGAKYSSIVDMVKVVNCVGMGTHRVAYLKADAAAAGDQTEGAAAGTATLGEFDFVDIKPTSVAVLDYISKQAKKQTPLQYAAKVKEQALIALRKRASLLLANTLKTDTNDMVITVGLSAFDAKTLRTLVLSYGGDESIVGGGVLFLNKKDLIAFGDVRGTNEKKAIYEIIPDSSNPNTGVIREGGLSVRYCINNNLDDFGSVGGQSKPCMFYGNPQCLELDLFSDYEVKVSEDFAFDKLMDTIRGDVELGAGIVVKGGFVGVHSV